MNSKKNREEIQEEVSQLMLDFNEQITATADGAEILFQLTKEQASQLHTCFMILMDGMTIAEDVKHSCMEILLELTKPEHQRLESFIYVMTKRLGKLVA